MSNFRSITERKFASLDLSKADIKRLIKRQRTGPIFKLDELANIGLSKRGTKKIQDMVERGEITFDDAAQDNLQPLGFAFYFYFTPDVVNRPSLTMGVTYTSTDGASQTNEVPIPRQSLHQAPQLTASGVDFADPIDLWVSDASGRHIFEKRYSPSDFAEIPSDRTFRDELRVDLLPVILPTIRRFRRSGRFMVLAHPEQRFDGYQLAVAAVGARQSPRITSLLQVSDLDTAAIRLTSDQNDVAGQLAALPFRPANFEFDGSFTVDQPAPEIDEPIGWAWVLSGPELFFGFQSDPNLEREQRDIVILLPTFALLESCADGVPMDADEQAILNRPDIFADDPGVVCKPFDNPGRILGERRFSTVLRVTDPKVKGGQRKEISAETPVPWEEDPTRFQAVSLARGHILDMRVRYRSNGYSLGDVAHSMTLAPRQTRRIVKIAFDRHESVRRSEEQVSGDELSQTTLRDRSYTDAVESSLNEWSKGGSKSSTTAAAVGGGFAAGPVVIGGGVAHSSSQSSSWQRGGRDVAASEEQNLRDAIRQYGDSLRSFEATVVNEVAQSETTEGVSEIVRNINYCHALSIVYYEILRHQRIDTEVAGVSECIFVPLAISAFTKERLTKHREVLFPYVRDRDQRVALRHIEHAPDFGIPEIPGTARKDQALSTLKGSIQLRLGITRPIEGEIAEEIEDGAKREKSESKRFKQLVEKYAPFAGFLPLSPTEIVHNLLDISEAERDRYFQRNVAPHIARIFGDKLRLARDTGGAITSIDSVDFTIAGTYHYGRTIRIDFQVRDPGDLTRAMVEKLVILAPETADITLPERSFADVTGGRIEFSTAHYERRVTTRGSSRDDIIDSQTGDPTSDGALLTFPVASYEERNDREEVQSAYNNLLDTLNRELYRYHKIIWWRMDRDELYTLLDGFTTVDAFNERHSLAGIVERRPIGILGNMLVFRVSQGIVLDENLKTPETMLAFYSDGSRREPLRVSLPTSGLYARAHMDSCNACERHSGTTDWVLDNPEPELADLPASLLQSRRADPASVTPTQMPETIINLQNAPDAPQTAGLGDILRTVSSSGAFRDMAGLAGTQQNVRAGLESATSLASGFGNMALQQSLARLKADSTAAQEVAAVAAANQEAVDMGASSPEAAREATEAFMRRKAEGLGKDQAQRVADRADEIIRSEGGGTQTTVTEDGVHTVTKEPAPTRAKDPISPYSVVPIPGTYQVLFMNFATGKAQLKADHVRALEILTGEIGLEIDNVVSIEGHASTAGSEESNYELGQERAIALFDQLHRLASTLGTPPNYTPEFLASTGEQGSYRERFRGVPKIANAPGDGDRNDPVEKAVLFTFKPSVDVRLEPRIVNFFGIEVSISGHLITFGDTILSVTNNNEVNISNRSDTTNTQTNINEETVAVTNGNIDISARDNNIILTATDNASVHIENLHVHFDNDGKFKGLEAETAAQSKKHTAWSLKFSAPTLIESSTRSLMDLVNDIADTVMNLEASPPNPSPTLTDIIAGLSTGDTVDVVIDLVLDKLGLGLGTAVTKQLLGMVRFGQVELNAEFKVKEEPDVKISGKMGGAGLIIGTTRSIPSAIVLPDADYTTAEAFKVSHWDDRGAFRDFAYVSSGVGSSISAITRAMALILEMSPALRMLDLSAIPNSIAMVHDTINRLGGGSQLIFRAFEEDVSLKAPPPAVLTAGQEMQAVIITPGAITFNEG